MKWLALVLMLLPANAGAQQLPEVMVQERTVPTFAGDTFVGWTLTYTNRQRDGLESVGGAEVVSPLGDVSYITWRIAYTPNFPCIGIGRKSAEACADKINVLDVPAGFVAVPESWEVLEGDSVEIMIIPDVMG